MDSAPSSRLRKEHYFCNTMIFRAPLHYRMHRRANLLAPSGRSQTSWATSRQAVHTWASMSNKEPGSKLGADRQDARENAGGEQADRG